jgi:HK97 family phage portal protein
MSIMDWFRGAERRSEPAAHVSSWDLLAGRVPFESGAGVPVSPHLAENLSAVFGCVQAISETVAVLPVSVYRSDGEDLRKAASSHPVTKLFARQPNDLQTPVEFLEMVTAHCLLRGNGYVEIIRDGRGAPVELRPLHPDWVGVMRLPGTRRLVYDVSEPESHGTRRVLMEDMLHLRDRSDDGFIGKSRLQRARETFGTAIATEEFAASTYKNGARVSGVLIHPDQIGDEAAGNLGDSFKQKHAGAKNAGSIPVLEEGVKWQQVSVSPADAEMLASRQFGVEQIARLYRVPMALLSNHDGAAYNSIIELNRMFAQHAVLPWVRRWEAAINGALLSEESRRTHWVEFDLDELTRANLLERWQAYRIAREVGAMNANEIRREERMNPRTDEAGNEFLSPLNMSSEQKGKPREE